MARANIAGRGVAGLLRRGRRAAKGIAGLQRNVEFTEYSPLSRSTELLRRLFSPLNALRIVEESTSSGKPLREQRVDLANETFTVYVPPHAPPHSNSQ
jgi:hypothetical protein